MMYPLFSQIMHEVVKHGPGVRAWKLGQTAKQQELYAASLPPKILDASPFNDTHEREICLSSQAFRAVCLINVAHNYGMEFTMCFGPSMEPTFSRHV
jgi:hypothetical protein